MTDLDKTASAGRRQGEFTPHLAAVEGRLPRGTNIERLRDAAEWSRQFEALGLNPQQ